MPGKCQQNKACALGSCGRAAAHASRVASLNTALYAVAGQAAQPSAGSHPPQPHMPPAHGGLPSSSTFRACGDAQVTRTDISCLRLMDTSPESEFHRTENPVAEGNPQINTILCRLWLWSSRLGAGLPASSWAKRTVSRFLPAPWWGLDTDWHQRQTAAGHLVYLLLAAPWPYTRSPDSFHSESPKTPSSRQEPSCKPPHSKRPKLCLSFLLPHLSSIPAKIQLQPTDTVQLDMKVQQNINQIY